MKYLDEKSQSITFDTVAWYRTVKPDEKNLTQPYAFVPDGAINYFAPYFNGLMTAPVARYENNDLCAKSENVKDLQHFFNTILNNDNLYFLYQPLWVPLQPVFRKYTNTGDIQELSEPEYVGGFWKIRYATLEKY